MHPEQFLVWKQIEDNQQVYFLCDNELRIISKCILNHDLANDKSEIDATSHVSIHLVFLSHTYIISIFIQE